MLWSEHVCGQAAPLASTHFVSAMAADALIAQPSATAKSIFMTPSDFKRCHHTWSAYLCNLPVNFLVCLDASPPGTDHGSYWSLDMSQSAEITSGVFNSVGHSLSIAYASVAKSASRKNDDVVAIKSLDGEVSILVADGASGFGFGDVAAKALAGYFQTSFESQATSRKAKRFLIDADEAVRQACAGDAEGSDTTGIVLSLLDGRIEGASAGDSQAIVFGSSTYELTAKQRRKPRIGNGAYAEDFTGRIAAGDVLVIATDGLWNRVKLDHVSKAVLSASGMDQAVAKLISMAKTSSGKFDDDVSVVCVSLT